MSQAPDSDLTELPKPDRVIDTVGLFCPIPVIRTGRAMAAMEVAQVLELVADDRGVLVDIPDWCQGHGQGYLGFRQRGRVYHLFVRKER